VLVVAVDLTINLICGIQAILRARNHFAQAVAFGRPTPPPRCLASSAPRAGRIWVIVRLDIDGDLRREQVTLLVRGIESGAKHESENIYRIDVVPTGGEKTTP
jgi:hypothetical protein